MPQLEELYGPINMHMAASRVMFQHFINGWGPFGHNLPTVGHGPSYFDCPSNYTGGVENGTCKVSSIKKWVRICQVTSGDKVLEILLSKSHLLVEQDWESRGGWGLELPFVA